MAVDYIYKLVSEYGTTIQYGDPASLTNPFGIEGIPADSLTSRIPSGETPFAEGQFMAMPIAGVRQIQYGGLITGNTAQAVRDSWDTFNAAHRIGTPIKFYKNSDRYLRGMIAEITQLEYDSLSYLRWSVRLQCQPYWYDNTLTQWALSVGGTAQQTMSGNVNSRPLLQLNFTHAGTATGTSQSTGQAFQMVARAAGLYQIDVDKGLGGQAGAVTVGGVDFTADFFGTFPELAPGSAPIAVTLSGGATMNWGSALSRARYQGA